jgi:hypothetical protein
VTSLAGTAARAEDDTRMPLMASRELSPVPPHPHTHTPTRPVLDANWVVCGEA